MFDLEVPGLSQWTFLAVAIYHGRIKTLRGDARLPKKTPSVRTSNYLMSTEYMCPHASSLARTHTSLYNGHPFCTVPWREEVASCDANLIRSGLLYPHSNNLQYFVHMIYNPNK